MASPSPLMMLRRVRGATLIAALLLTLSMAAYVLAQSKSDEVTFTVEFPLPLLEGGVLTPGAEAAVRIPLTITNHSSATQRFSLYRSVLPELSDARGVVLSFDYGANRSAPPHASDYPLLPPEQSIVFSFNAMIGLHGDEIDWKGEQGVIGYWKVTQSAAPYRLRLRYRQSEVTVGPLDNEPEFLAGLWIGELVTDGIELPIKFAN
jgi:hypothetical protein